MFFTGEVLENRQVSKKMFFIRIVTPMVSPYVPGQFLMLRGWEGTDPLLPRPFAIYSWKSSGNGNVLDIIYKVVGRGTMILSGLRKGEPVHLNGPLGNGFTLPPGIEQVLLAGGGIGFSSVLPVALKMVEKGIGVRVLLGAKSNLDIPPLEEIGAGSIVDQVSYATEDGTAGFRGLVTEIVERETDLIEGGGKMMIFACGPDKMLKVVKGISLRRNIPAYVSMENFMACGFGVCLGCVIRIGSAGKEEHQRVCMEGPVFKAHEVIFDD